METRHLRHFIAVAESGSVTRAADQLGIAQPALSQSIRRLEEQLHAKLFSRSRSGSVLTLAGEAILDDVRMSLARIDAAAKLAREIAEGRSGSLTIGFLSTVMFDVLPQAMRRHQEVSPNVRFILREMGSREQAEALEEGVIDIGLVQTPLTVRGRMRQKVIASDPFIAAVYEGFPVGADGKVSLRALAREGIVFFPEQQLPLIHAGVCDAIRTLGEDVRIVQEANRTVTILACVAARCGVSLLPSATRRLSFHGVRYCAIRERSLLPVFTLSAVWPVRSRPTLADSFASCLKTQQELA